VLGVDSFVFTLAWGIPTLGPFYRKEQSISNISISLFIHLSLARENKEEIKLRWRKSRRNGDCVIRDLFHRIKVYNKTNEIVPQLLYAKYNEQKLVSLHS